MTRLNRALFAFALLAVGAFVLSSCRDSYRQKEAREQAKRAEAEAAAAAAASAAALSGLVATYRPITDWQSTICGGGI